MKIFTIIARVLLGLVFVIFGSNAFLHFLPMPPLPQGVAGEYLHAFFASGYVYFIGGFQVIGGLVVSHFDGTRGPANRNCRYDS